MTTVETSTDSGFDRDAAAEHLATLWSTEIVPELERYIAVPALSPNFDADWETTGHLDTVVGQVGDWLASRPVAGMTVEVQRLDGRTPLIVVDVEPFNVEPFPGGAATTTLLYGHVDKQPEMEGWRDDLGPWTPVRVGDRLYGRGGADDGYAAFAALGAIEAVQQSGGRHGRCVLLIEASEESGSPDLPAHLDALGDRLGQVGLVICLDSGCGDYDTLWLTTSLRGMVAATLAVDILDEGMHSGAAGGVVPSSFRILRILLDRLEEAASGRVLVDSANVEIPAHRVAEAQAMCEALHGRSPEPPAFVDGAGPVHPDPVESALARTWRPSLAYVGADGLPPTAKAGNVLRPSTSLKLSLRLPPTADPDAVRNELAELLTADPPYGARISLAGLDGAAGWNAPELDPWLAEALHTASEQVFGRPMQLMGEGGTIPFMGMLGERFPEAQFVITGVLGPASNAHGPNEFIDVAYAEKLNRCMADILVAAADR